jgi:hypothetical protein
MNITHRTAEEQRPHAAGDHGAGSPPLLAEFASALGTVGELAAPERLDRLAVLPVRGVHWNDLGDPERVLATRRRTRAMPMREPTLEPISA